MSDYPRLWLTTQKDLEKLIELDKSVLESEPIEKRVDAIKQVLPIYYQYRRIVERLTACHNQIFQPQIREIIIKMLDYSIVRMLEYRLEMLNLTCIDCPWSNDFLLEAKLQPDDIDLSAPLYNSASRMAEFERRRRVVANSQNPNKKSISENTSLAASMQTKEDSLVLQDKRKQVTSQSEETSKLELNERLGEKCAREMYESELKTWNDDAMLLIQSHERARISRRITKKAEQQRLYDLKLASGQIPDEIIDVELQARAASIIQKTWRGYVARRELKRRTCQTEVILGMIIPSWNRNQHFFQHYQAQCEEKLNIQKKAAQHLEKTINSEKEKIWESRGPSLVEDIQDEIREWFFLWFNEIRYFDSIPKVKVGGSMLVATGQVRTPAEYLAELAAGNDKNKKKGEDSGTESKEESDEKDDEDEKLGWKMQDSKALPYLLSVNAEFQERWSHRTEQILNARAGLILDLIWNELYYKLQLEMRGIADERMREEAKKLNQALATDYALDGLPFSPPKPQIFKGEKKAGEPRQRRGDQREPLANLSEDELLVELARCAVLQLEELGEECRLAEWPGALSLVVRASPEIRLGDLKQPVMDYCVLPIGSKRVHQLAPLIRSVCLCGPPGSGQRFLARAICSELKATVFDLTPEKHVGRFIKRESQNRLVQAVIKLAKAYAPSVVLVEGEKAWLKKLPAEMKHLQPKRFASIYTKIVKAIKPGDQVLFLTTSSEPYLAGKSFVKLHDKFIMIPVADYGSMYLGYKNGLMSQHNVERQLQVSGLARLTHKETPIELLQKVLNTAAPLARRIDSRRRPLRPEEIFERWLEADRPTEHQLQSLDKFRNKLPLERKRRKLQEGEKEEATSTRDAKKKNK